MDMRAKQRRDFHKQRKQANIRKAQARQRKPAPMENRMLPPLVDITRLGVFLSAQAAGKSTARVAKASEEIQSFMARERARQ
ncbi:MAG TPA: hypothetical protein VHA37_01765 [Candidatus Saccharimonadales bacterium]|nr:hypothetical protein [Candidatus Saccharimonadales bacterium]